MQKRKPIIDPKTLGAELRARRKSLGKTLAEIAELTSINVGQLSRLENGHMKRDGGNLQKLAAGLQKLETAPERSNVPDVVGRFVAVINRSNRHEKAATALVSALEQLM